MRKNGGTPPTNLMLQRAVGILILVLSGCGLPACQKSAPPRGLPGERIRLDVGGNELIVEVASDALTRERGLMERESLPENAGMLFITPRTQKQSFWMKNTLIPLSIAFIDDDGTILQIEHMRPKDLRHTRSIKRVRYSLEVNKGWFERNQIKVGDRLTDFEESVRRFDAS